MNRQDRIPLFDHYEHHLGGVKLHWKPRDSPEYDLKIFCFDATRTNDGNTLFTFGISDHQLYSADGERRSRLEHVVFLRDAGKRERVAALLLAIASHALGKHHSPGIHHVFGGEGPVMHGGNPDFEHFYLSRPLAGEPDFATCDTMDPPIALVQLIPISNAEKAFIETWGGACFELLLLEQCIDIRPSMNANKSRCRSRALFLLRPCPNVRPDPAGEKEISWA